MQHVPLKFHETQYIITTSNQDKINEFISILGEERVVVQKGRDIKEVFGTMDEVILHKSFDAGVGYIVEDTILEVDGKEIVDIRYNIEKFADKNIEARWIVSLGFNDGDNIYVYRGIIKGQLVAVDEIPFDAFGFDPYFVPNGSKDSLYTLKQNGQKDLFSARKIALENLLLEKAIIVTPRVSIKPWTGKYQK